MTDQATATITVAVEIRIYDPDTGELRDTISSTAKLTKGDAGRADAVNNGVTSVTVDAFETGKGFKFPKLSIRLAYEPANPKNR